ncbi:hypothetical protein C8R44DRAFT_847990 [Mycena epipterygia]|nr:hypothetical protein C8R44DRAFT_847990 [Mycena epipterygia]
MRHRPASCHISRSDELRDSGLRNHDLATTSDSRARRLCYMTSPPTPSRLVVSEGLVAADPDPALCLLELEPTIESSASSLISATVALNLVLPSLPSVLRKPKARPPIEDKDASPQDFGPPSTEYHDRRFPLGTITNVPGLRVKTPKVGAVPKIVKSTIPTGASCGHRSRTKRSHPVPVEAAGAPEAQDPSSMPVVPTAAVVSIVADPEPAPNVVAPAPGSEEWNSNKSALLAQVRSWNKQVKASRRQSTSLPACAPVTVPASAPVISAKRHSAPPVLVASSKAPRLDLQDLLASLIREAEVTIAALGAENPSGALGVGAKISKKDEEIRTFSVVALENRSIFVIGEDSEDEDDEPVTPSPQRRSHDPRSLPTVNPVASVASPGLISSISASRSMAVLANASSWSISSLLSSFDEVLAGPRWQRLLFRSGRIRNDSAV